MKKIVFLSLVLFALLLNGCASAKTYAAGCIAVAEENVKYILTKIDKNTRVIINYSD